MFSFLEKLAKKRARKKKPKLKKKKKKGKLLPSPHTLVPAVLTAALLIPVVLGLPEDSGSSCDSSGSSSASAGTGSTFGDLSCGTNAGGTNGSQGGSGNSESNSGSGHSGSTGNDSTGSLDGLVLAYQEVEAPAVVPDESDSSESDSTVGGGSGNDSAAGGGDEPTTIFDMPNAPVMCIEEDWELTVSHPDTQIAGPQLWTVMTPFDSADIFHMAFAMNYRMDPSFNAGGMELQAWYKGQLLGWGAAGDALLATPNETVRWTQRLEIKGGKLWFSVVSGESITWGSFGNGGSLHLCMDTTLPSLNAYHPNVSVSNSGVLFASNRVKSLILKEVRGYSAENSLLLYDNNEVFVYRGDD